MRRQIILDIISFIISHPACTAKDIVTDLGYNRRNIQSWLSAMTRSKLVSRRYEKQPNGKWAFIYYWSN